MIHVIINPVAGNGHSAKVGDQICEKLKEKNLPFTVSTTTHPGHAKVLSAQAAQEGIKTVLSVGGDGTAYEVTAGLAFTGSALGIIPAGTGNDVIKTLGMPKKPLEALEHILDHPPKQIDLGRYNDHLFLNVCGMGFDVAVLEHSEKAKKYVRGLLPYLYGLIKTIITFKPSPMKISIDGKALPDEAYLVCSVANGRYIGGGIPIAPNANINDGLLDVVIVKSVPNYKLPKYLPGLLGGKILTFPITSHYLCKSVTIESSNMKTNVDGEILPLNKATFEPLPQALWVHY